HPLPQGNDLYAVAHGNGRFVAVGQGGTILVSGDGVTWTNRSVEWDNLVAIAFGNGVFVAVGFLGGLLTSPDGEHWIKPAAPTGVYPRELLGVSFGNGRFVAVGNGIVVWSTDAVHWQGWEDAISFLIPAVVYGDGKFVAYPSYPSLALTSSDGANWSTNMVEPSGFVFQDVRFGNGSFVGAAGVLLS